GSARAGTATRSSPKSEISVRNPRLVDPANARGRYGRSFPSPLSRIAQLPEPGGFVPTERGRVEAARQTSLLVKRADRQSASRSPTPATQVSHADRSSGHGRWTLPSLRTGFSPTEHEGCATSI